MKTLFAALGLLAFASFAFAQDTSSMPSFKGLTWGAGIATVPHNLSKDYSLSDYDYDYYTMNNGDTRIDAMTADQIVYGFRDDRFVMAVALFSGRENFDRALNTYLVRYGNPDREDYNTGERIWMGNDLMVRLEYQQSTGDGVLSIVYQ